MNKICYDVLLNLYINSYINQRQIAKECSCSLGIVNKALRMLEYEGLLNTDYSLSESGLNLIKRNSPKNAIILAAGRGTRMIPINLEKPKSLVEINGKPLIEYQIEQLLYAGITEIHIVVGFLKEKFDYLIDKYNVNLIVNMQYNEKNNLHSLYKASTYLGNSYIIPADLYCIENPFSSNEVYSWYMLSNKYNSNSDVCPNNKSEIVKGKNQNNRMIGISYVSDDDSEYLKDRLQSMANCNKYNNSFWEEACYKNDKMFQFAKIVNDENYFEINTYEDLRRIDGDSDNLKSKSIEVIQDVFNCKREDIDDIKPLKKGMTNRSFLFSAKGKKYIMRIPGEGTDNLIDRKSESEVYEIINNKGICDNVIYINSETGYKISQFIENARVCDSSSKRDLILCMDKLRELHNLDLKVNHFFDLFQQIQFYEELRQGNESVYRDYKQTKENVFSLKKYIDSLNIEYKLTHIDAIPDNFLFYNDDKEVCLIDWEYSAMQDPHVDLAMFSIYSYYNKAQIDDLIDIYFENICPVETRIKIYCYIAVCGLLWSNWCEYKLICGVEFGEYSIKQYRYAKDFYKIAIQEIENFAKENN